MLFPISVGAVRSIAAMIGQINEISSAIASAIEEQRAATREIAQNVYEASTGTNEVSANVAGISDAAAQTGEVATRVTVAASRIEADVDVLRGEVRGFLEGLKRAG